VCAYHYTQLLYTIQRRTVLIIFPPSLHTFIRAQIRVARSACKFLADGLRKLA